jgi:hypothetical protein
LWFLHFIFTHLLRRLRHIFGETRDGMTQDQLVQLKEQQLALADATQDSMDALRRVEARRGATNAANTTRDVDAGHK